MIAETRRRVENAGRDLGRNLKSGKRDWIVVRSAIVA